MGENVCRGSCDSNMLHLGRRCNLIRAGPGGRTSRQLSEHHWRRKRLCFKFAQRQFVGLMKWAKQSLLTSLKDVSVIVATAQDERELINALGFGAIGFHPVSQPDEYDGMIPEFDVVLKSIRNNR